jgi:hypothetical protein
MSATYAVLLGLRATFPHGSFVSVPKRQRRGMAIRKTRKTNSSRRAAAWNIPSLPDSMPPLTGLVAALDRFL